jgi:cell division protease FtsH
MISIMNGMTRRTADPDPFQGDYNAFIRALQQGQVASISIVQKADVREIRGSLIGGAAFSLNGPPFDESLTEMLKERNIPFFQRPIPQNILGSFLLNFLPMILLIGLMFFMLQQTQSGGKAMQFGKSRAKLQSVDKKNQKVCYWSVCRAQAKP